MHSELIKTASLDVFDQFSIKIREMHSKAGNDIGVSGVLIFYLAMFIL